MDNLQNGEKQSEMVVVMVPFPAQGHLNQLLHLSYLLSSYNLPINFFSTTPHIRQAKLRIHGWDPLSASRINFHESEVPHFPSPPPDPNASTKFPTHLLPSFEASSHLRQPFIKLLDTLSKSAKRVIVIYDNLMGIVVQDVASFPNAEAYMFIPCSAFNVFWTMWERMGKPDLDFDKEVSKEVPSLEGCYSRESMEFLQSRDMSTLPTKFHSGIVYDTCKVIEGEYLDLIGKLEQGIGMSISKVWAVGPFNPVKMTTNNRHKCLEWLDEQEAKSVIYVSFGTTTSLSDEQIQEIANGLEASGVKFIWVLRDADRGDIFNGEEEVRKVELPKGYEKRLKGKGIVERGWVPQLEILGHPSTGGFMSHCGWNSCMESVTMGVPIAAWPMHSDQPRNAALITNKALKTGILVRDWEDRDEVVSCLTIENVVRRLIVSEDGEAIRKRAAEIGGAVRQSMEEGGATRVELDSFVSHIVNY